MGYSDSYLGNGTWRRTISGSDSIEDVDIYAGTPDYNRGRVTPLYWGVIGPYQCAYFVRFSASLIPTGSLVNVRWNITPAGAQNNSVNVPVYRVVDGSTWVEGTQIGGGGIEVGSCCYTYAKYNTQRWASGGAFSSADLVVDANPPIQNFIGGVGGYVDLPVAWYNGFRNGTLVNNGFCVADIGVAGSYMWSTDVVGEPSKWPYFTIDYRPVTKGRLRYHAWV